MAEEAQGEAGLGTNAAANIVNGWKVQLTQCEAENSVPDPHCGEKGLSSPVTIGGIVTFTTCLPNLNTVTSSTPTSFGTAAGGGLLYGLDLQTAGAAVDFDPTPEAGAQVTLDRFVRLKSPGIPSDVVVINPESILPPDLFVRKIPGRRTVKTFWYERQYN